MCVCVFACVRACLCDLYIVYILYRSMTETREPVWPSGKALGCMVSGRTSVRYRFGSPFSSKKVVICENRLVTLAVITRRFSQTTNIKMALIAAHLNAEVILVVTV